MDLEDAASNLVDDTVSNVQEVATTAYLFRKKLGLTPEAGAEAVAGAEVPKVAADTGPRVSPDAWDKSIQEGFQKKGVPAEKSGPLAESDARLSPDEWDKRVKDGFKSEQAAAEPHAQPNAKPTAGAPGEVGASDAAATKASTKVAERIEPTLGNTKSGEPHAPEAKTATASPKPAHTPAPNAPEPHAAPTKPMHADARVEPHLPKTSTPAVEAGHGHVQKPIGHAPEHGLGSVKAPHGLHPTASAGLHRAEVAAAELAAKESASVALKGALRVAVGPEVAIGVAVVSALPRAYTFVDEASGHAISKSSVGQGVAWLNEQSGANHAARQVSGWVDSGMESLTHALEKTGGDKVLIKAAEALSRYGEQTGISAGLAKAGELWDAGAAKLEKVIRDNVHGPDNPAHKAPATVAHAPDAAHHATAPVVAKVASSAGEVPHPPAAAKHATNPSSHHETGAGAHSSAPKHAAAEAHHAQVAHGPAIPHKPTAHPAHVEHAAPKDTSPALRSAAVAALAKSPASVQDVTASELAASVPGAASREVADRPLTGAAGLSKALEGHMATHGMELESKALAEPIGRAVTMFLNESPNSPASLVINPKTDALATMTGPGAAPTAGDLPHIRSETLQDVAKSGINPAGVSELRDGLPAETKGKSDLQLADAVGVSALAKIGEKGLDVPAVEKVQEHLAKSAESADFSLAPDRLSATKVLHDLESGNREFAVIERSAAGQKLLGAMSESEFAARPASPGTDLIALDVSDLRKELRLPESVQAESASAKIAVDSGALRTDTPAERPTPVTPPPQPKPEAPGPEMSMSM